MPRVSPGSADNSLAELKSILERTIIVIFVGLELLSTNSDKSIQKQNKKDNSLGDEVMDGFSAYFSVDASNGCDRSYWFENFYRAALYL